MKTPMLGCGHFRAFRPGFTLWHTCHVVRHGHFTLKQLRLPVLNEMHTNSCTGSRLMVDQTIFKTAQKYGFNSLYFDEISLAIIDDYVHTCDPCSTLNAITY